MIGVKVSNIPLRFMIDQSPSRRSASLVVARAFNAIPVAVKRFGKYIPDKEERTAFAERALKDLSDPNVHMTFNMYKSIDFSDSSETVIGRKPAVVF